ncbi:Gfo/Idh/MocA family protein [Oceanobacillus sp. Castelsardo]|uniref:Gfo/Idh/MocA family protein n=1 Tax=Oceanobacillus sp. Castelsardo TaxID=1851204 RepID=UPI000837CA33|nr:Gfo/Idh/MocA family oxidoreductase [Oceanobacillus sp. Castelsardo]
MKKVRWGILSTAKIAQKELIPAFERGVNAEVTAIATGSGLEKAKTVAETFGIEKTYDRYEALLDDPDIDAVYIPLPNHLHKEWVIKAARKGKHILCEKPAALHADDVVEMKKVCEEEKVLFMEGFMYYFHPQHNRVREIIRSGEIGDVKFVRASFSFNLSQKGNSIKMSPEKGGGSIYDVGCYGIHAIRNAIGVEPNSVYVHPVIDSDFGVDTDVVAYLTFPNQIRATFDVSFGMYRRSEYEVIGTEGRIIVPKAFRPDWWGGDGFVITEKEDSSRTEVFTADQYRNEVEHLSNAILNDLSLNQLEHDFENSINNMRVIDACLKSISTESKVEL